MHRSQKRQASRANRKSHLKHQRHLLRHNPRCAPYHALGWAVASSPTFTKPIVAGRDDKWM